MKKIDVERNTNKERRIAGLRYHPLDKFRAKLPQKSNPPKPKLQGRIMNLQCQRVQEN